MVRHRGVYRADRLEPYELSRSRVENYVRCPACFYMQQVEGIKFPSIPGYNINEATDVLLKRDFDKCRQLGVTHSFLRERGYGHLVPLQHEKIKKWTQSLHFGADGYFHTVHQPTNLKIGGGIDDVWLNSDSGQVHIVDYKSTSQKSPGREISLEDKWKASYKRQMDLYVWIMQRMGLKVSEIGYFIYCDGDRFTDKPFLGSDFANMYFKISILPYCTTQQWIEPTLLGIRNVLGAPSRPNHSEGCEYGSFLVSCR